MPVSPLVPVKVLAPVPAKGEDDGVLYQMREFSTVSDTPSCQQTAPPGVVVEVGTVFRVRVVWRSVSLEPVDVIKAPPFDAARLPTQAVLMNPGQPAVILATPPWERASFPRNLTRWNWETPVVCRMPRHCPSIDCPQRCLRTPKPMNWSGKPLRPIRQSLMRW